MRRLAIPSTDLQVAALCLGASDFGATVSQSDAFALLDAYAEQGGNFLDTARIYADWIPNIPRSVSELTLGCWMKARGNRQQIVVATKGGHPDLAAMQRSRLSPADLVSDIEASLRQLQTDVIDLYWLHRDDPTLPVASIIDTLAQQVKTGKIRYVAASNWRTARIQAALDYAQSRGLTTFVANQPLWSLGEPAPGALGMPGLVSFGQEEADFHRRTGMAVIPYSSQANGFFTKLAQAGKQTPAPKFWANLPGLKWLSRKDAAQVLKPAVRKTYLTPANLRRFERVKELAERRQTGVTQIVLAYLTSQPFVTIPIIGCKTLQQLRDSLKASELRLTPEEIDFLLC
jgi:aryl-alcohol dehydrogenase-like predicted oxidoreductase